MLLFITCGGDRNREDRALQKAGATDHTEKDLNNFRLPEEVTRRAPLMQEHIYNLLPVLTPRFELKPSYVLADGEHFSLETMERGEIDVFVTRLNMLHLAYYKDSVLTWSGTVLYGVGKSRSITTRDGYLIILSIKDSSLSLSFRDGQTEFRDQFHFDRDHRNTLEEGPHELYVNHFVIPEQVMRRMGN